MKKAFLLLTLIATTISAWGVTTVTKTVSELKTTYGWANDKCYYQPFALDDVITISSVDGTAKYLDNSKEMRYYQGNDKGYGSIIIKAKAGYVITSVKLKYSQTAARTVPCYFWYNTNASILTCDTLPNNVARSFYSNQVVLNIGRTSNATSGQIRVTEYSVTYEQASYGRFYTKSTMDLGMQYGWAHGTHPVNITLNNVLSLHSAASTLKYYGNDKVFACYQNNGAFWFNARSGATIKRIRVYYFPQGATSSSEGVLCLSSDFGTDGKSIASAKQIASGQTVAVNASSVSFNVGNKKSATGAQIRISGFQIEYTDGSSQMETFTNLNSAGNTSEVKYAGDNGYKWKVKNFTHRDTCAMYDYLGTRLNYNGYIATDGAIEGGIKDVSFDWRMSLDANITSTTPVNFSVKVGSKTDNVTAAPVTKSAGHYMTYDSAFAVKSNCDFSINLGAKASTAQARPIIGPVTITPYLLYTKKSVTIAAKDYASQNFKYTNTALINNTAGEGTVSYAVSGENANKIASINSSTGEVTILGAGTVTVTASWEQVTTTYQLTIQLETPAIGFAEPLVTKMISAASYKQTLTFTTPSSGTGIYSIVSGPASGTIDADGTVHFTEAGDYVIKGKFNTLPYKPDSATYTLKVTDLLVPTLSFAASSIEKPMGAADFTNALTTTAGIGDTTYTSSVETVATVDNGLVHIIGAGTTTIKAATAQTGTYAAGEATYSLKVFPLSDISFAGDTNVYLNAPAFTRAAKVNAGDGAITYASDSAHVATVNATTGEVEVKGSGTAHIYAYIAKTDNYWADTTYYTLNVSKLKKATASFDEGTVNKVQGFGAFTNTLTTESDGVKHFTSSDTRVATVDDNGLVTKGEKPGTTTIKVEIDASATWEKIEAQYTLSVSSAPIADMKNVSSTITALKTKLGWQDAPAKGQEYTNISLDSVLTLSAGKHLYENVYGTGKTDLLRYYRQNSETSASKFTIQAKAGVIIKSVKFTYGGNANTVLTDAYYSGTVAESKRILSGQIYKVDANAVTFHTGSIGSGAYNVDVTGIEITYFDPSKGVAVTKHAFDLGKNAGLVDNTCYQNVAINNAITLHADANNTMRYSKDGYFNCYRWCGAIDIKARKGATIHYVKVTYTTTNNAVLTKYYGTDGKNIPAVDRIASDSIIYVNADSLKLYVGSTTSDGGTASIKKIYVNYTDNSEVVVDNFDKCDQTSGDSVAVAGVDGKYNWTFKNFSRQDNMTNRMYYDQSVLINKGGKVMTEYTGGLQEVAFDWHPTESGKDVKFTVKAGESTWNVTKTAADMNKVYTFNFQKTAIKSNGEFSIAVDGTSGTTVEIGHVSLTPYLLYACMDTTIAAKDYKDAGWKFTGPSLINYTGEEIAYSMEGDASVAEVNPTSGEVTILGGGTVTVKATAATAGVTASYQLTINLESTSAEFAKKEVKKLLKDGTFAQKLHITTEATEGNEVTYSFVGEHDGATLEDSTVTFTKVGDFTIMGMLKQNMPYAAAVDTYLLKVTDLTIPSIKFDTNSVEKPMGAEPFTITLTTTPGIGDTTYTSSVESVATISEDGQVSIVGPGTTIIKAATAETEVYQAGEASYTLKVFSLPVMSFAEGDKDVYLNAGTFTYAVTKTAGDGVITYTSSEESVATVNNDGQVTVKAAGQTTITANIAKGENYWSGSASYELTVDPMKQAKPAFVQSTMIKQLSDDAFTNVLNKDNSDGQVTYSSSNESVAKVDANGLVTLQGATGTITITADLAASETYIAASASYTLIVNAEPIPGGKTVYGNIAQIAAQSGWTNDSKYAYFKLDKVISVEDTAKANAKYNKNEESLIYAQGTKKGLFTIRAKAGAIIQAVKLTYTSANNGVVTNNYGTDGKKIAEANQYLSGVTYMMDANKLTFYTGSTSDNADAKVHIKDIMVKYFYPETGVAVTKNVIDLAKQYNLKNDTSYMSLSLNNAITMSVTKAGTMKYLDGTNVKELRFYQGLGAVTISAREGAKINYVKVTYSSVNNGVFTTDASRSSVPVAEQVASDSILFVDAQSISLYPSSSSTNTNGQPRVRKIYVNYTDKSEAIVDNFNNCTKIYGGNTPIEVMGVDSTFTWEFTEFNRDSLRRIGYDQSTMLRQNGGKIAANNEEGGVKEVSFDWFASNSNKGVKFYVKAGGQTFTIDSAAANGYYPATFTKTGIKSNGAFSIEVDQNSGSQLEFGHISLTPYLLYTTKSNSMKVGFTYTNTDIIDNRGDSEIAITYESSDEDVATVDANGQVTAKAVGEVTITAKWEGVSTTYTLTISANELIIDEEDTNLAQIVAEYDGKEANVTLKRAMTADGTYNTIYLPFALTEEQVTAVFGEDANVAELISSSLEDNLLTLNFDFVNEMQAGVPYLVAPTQDVTEKVIEQVTIDKEDHASTCEGGEFHGILEAQSIAMADKYFLGNDNKLITYTAIDNYNTKGLRAYFTLKAPAGVQARCVIGRGTTTDIIDVNGNANVNGNQKMIINNQLVIIRDGKMFNAQGIRL